MKKWKILLFLFCLGLFLPVLKTIYIFDLEQKITKVYASEIDRLNGDSVKEKRIKEFEIKQLNTKMNSKIEELKNKNGKVSKIINGIDKHLQGKLSNKGEVFYYAGNLYNVNPMLLAAIAIHETGNGTSNILKKYNNVGGVNRRIGFKSEGRYAVYVSIDESIFDLAKLLKEHYINKGLDTIDKIGDKYCPLSDAEDASMGYVNQHWKPLVTKYYKTILKDCEV